MTEDIDVSDKNSLPDADIRSVLNALLKELDMRVKRNKMTFSDGSISIWYDVSKQERW